MKKMKKNHKFFSNKEPVVKNTDSPKKSYNPVNANSNTGTNNTNQVSFINARRNTRDFKEQSNTNFTPERNSQSKPQNNFKKFPNNNQRNNNPVNNNNQKKCREKYKNQREFRIF